MRLSKESTQSSIQCLRQRYIKTPRQQFPDNTKIDVFLMIDSIDCVHFKRFHNKVSKNTDYRYGSVSTINKTSVGGVESIKTI